ncbi:hypothetical protein GCM10027515_01390 [Schumannella luteola]|uniref:Glycosyltransferase involved in cell wall biosynthesis n=1 Tax=Schumannella luteola TaxID=472059 RepID=A0A852YC09_9MICO|nr:glycosyltransferase involved in cell wall biosynthesis [Schumannella luteola]
MTAAAPRVGIVLRTKNRPVFLARAVRDVLAQSFADWHLVVANDGGDAAQVRSALAPFEQQLAGRLTVLDVVAPNGRCAAANQGLRAVDAGYVVLHDDDDSWHPEFLATTVEHLDAHPEHGGVMVPIEIVYEKQRGAEWVETGREPLWPGLKQITLFDMLQINRAVPISFLYRRALHDEVGFYDETLEAVEDWEFYLRVLVAGEIGFIAGRILAYWSLRPASRGHEGNSMYALGDIHERYDTLVRDRALRLYIRDHGLGVPLMVAGLIERQTAQQTKLLRAGGPITRVLRRVRDRVTGRG